MEQQLKGMMKLGLGDGYAAERQQIIVQNDA